MIEWLQKLGIPKETSELLHQKIIESKTIFDRMVLSALSHQPGRPIQIGIEIRQNFTGWIRTKHTEISYPRNLTVYAGSPLALRDWYADITMLLGSIPTPMEAIIQPDAFLLRSLHATPQEVHLYPLEKREKTTLKSTIDSLQPFDGHNAYMDLPKSAHGEIQRICWNQILDHVGIPQKERWDQHLVRENNVAAVFTQGESRGRNKNIIILEWMENLSET